MTPVPAIEAFLTSASCDGFIRHWDVLIVQTVLANAGRFELVDDDLRYTDYSRAHKGSPRILTATDLPLLASGRYHFARKFDLGVDGEVLDRIERELLGAAGYPS